LATVNGSTPADAPPKYRDALERSGNPKDTREIMVKWANWDAPLAILRRRVPFVKN
jgi:hypothetical protein